MAPLDDSSNTLARTQQEGTTPDKLWDLRCYEVTDCAQVPHCKHQRQGRCGFVAGTYSCRPARLPDPRVRKSGMMP